MRWILNRKFVNFSCIGGIALFSLVCVGQVHAQNQDCNGLVGAQYQCCLDPEGLCLPPQQNGVNTVWHGAWLPIKRAIKASQITDFESKAGKSIASEIYYVGWYLNAWADVQRQINVWEPMGIIPHIVWEPRLKGRKSPLDAILNGSQDAIIDDFAKQAAIYGEPFFLRFAHEMNGNWYPWSGAQNGGSEEAAQKYISAWRYVHDRMSVAGNIIWVWAPNWESVPLVDMNNNSWNKLENYYPGDEYVDWVGVDFFGLRWDDVAVADNISDILPYAVDQEGNMNKPIMVAETAAADCANYFVDPETGAVLPVTAKADWITEFFQTLESNPAIRAFFWFNENKKGEADWRITSCPDSAQDNYSEGILDCRYVGRLGLGENPSCPQLQ